MNDSDLNEINKAAGALGQLGISAGQYLAARESAQTIVKNQVRDLSRELAAWNYLETVMTVNPPTKDEEEALWSLITRARRERCY
jgi:hypothetical protein